MVGDTSCSDCGAPVRAGAAFCTRCGTALGQTEAAPSPDTSSPPADLEQLPPPPGGTPGTPDATTPDPDVAERGRSGPRRWLLTASFLVWTAAVFLAGFAVSHWAFVSWVPRSSPDTAVSVTSVLPELDAAAGGPIRVPDVVGLRRGEAVEAFTDVGVLPDIVTVQRVPWVGSGNVVVSQDPPTGTRDPAEITIQVSEPAPVPDVVGLPVDEATRELEAIGARVDTTFRYVPGAVTGEVTGVDPAAGQTAPSLVTLTVAASPSAVFVSEVPATRSDCHPDDVTIDTVAHPNSMACNVFGDEAMVVEYTLNRRVDRFEAVVGQDDAATSGARVRFRVLGDGTELSAVTVPFGSSRELDVDTRGVLRLRLVATLLGQPDDVGHVGAWGDARLLGSADAIQQAVDQ